MKRDGLTGSSTQALADFLSQEAPIAFASRPTPVEVDLRLQWRLPLLLLILRVACRQGRTSLRRLHALNWGIRTQSAQRVLLAALDGSRRPQDVIIRVDPILNQVVGFALAEGLIATPGGDHIQLTTTGHAAADAVVTANDCYVTERAFLKTIRGAVTEQWVESLTTIQGVL